MKSIRRELTKSLAGNLAALAILCGAALYAYMHYTLTAEFDRALLDKASLFIAMSEQDTETEGGMERRVSLSDLSPDLRDKIVAVLDGGRVVEIEEIVHDGGILYEVDAESHGVKRSLLFDGNGVSLDADGEFAFEFSQATLPEYQPSPDAEYYQVWDEDGDTLAKSPSLADERLQHLRARGKEAVFENIALPNGRAGRAVALRFHPQAMGERGEPLQLVMARSRGGLNNTLATLVTGLALVALLMALGAAMVVRQNVAKGLQPLDNLASETAAIDANNLAHRFKVDAMPDELRPIGEGLNEFLARLDGAFQREKRFTSDVAHELRTPIAELRALAEVGLRTTPTAEGETRQSFRDAAAIARQMERLVETLLRLARGESGALAVKYTRFDLVELIRHTWTIFEERAASKNLDVAFGLPVTFAVETDRELLSAILNNLLTNAMCYTPADGTVEIAITTDAAGTRISMTNTVTDLVQADLDHILEPFWRKDKARTDTAHSGVGLSVVAVFAKLLGINLRLEMPEEKLLRVSLEIPGETAEV